MVSDDFIQGRTIDVSLADGTPLRVRPIRPDDKALLVEGMKHLSWQSRYRRFFSPLETLSPALLERLTEIDYVDHFAWIALNRELPDQSAIAVGRYIRTPDRPACAEIAITVADEYQGRGVGTLLLELLGLVAREHGISEFTAIVLPENRAMRQLLHNEGIDATFDSEVGALRGTGPIPPLDELRNAGLVEQVRAALGDR